MTRCTTCIVASIAVPEDARERNCGAKLPSSLALPCDAFNNIHSKICNQGVQDEIR